MNCAVQNIFSVDVEDWFNISASDAEPDVSTWDALPSRVEKNFHKMLDMFAEHDAHVTCFFVAYFARRFPQLVRRAIAEGHEVASHGLIHKLVFEQSADEFYEDVRQARQAIEDVAGQPVRGYRAAAFSVTEKTPWFFDRLTQAGYQYDSSVFPAPHGIGGIKTSQLGPHTIQCESGRLLEFPISAVNVLGKPMCCFGGGYLRFFPYWLIEPFGRKVEAEGRPIVFYIHPREIDPRPASPTDECKAALQDLYQSQTTEPKMRSILRDFEITTFRDFIAGHADELRAS